MTNRGSRSQLTGYVSAGATKKSEILADGAVEKHGGYRRVDATAEAEHDLIVAKLLAQSLDCRLDKRQADNLPSGL